MTYFFFLVLPSLLNYVVAKDYERFSDSCSYILQHFKDIQRQGLSLHTAVPMSVKGLHFQISISFSTLWLEYAAKVVPC